MWRVRTARPALRPACRCPCPLHTQYYGEQDQWPKTVAQYGQFDLAGFPKPASRWYRDKWLRHPNATETRAQAATVGERLAAGISARLDAAAVLAASPAPKAKATLSLGVDVPSASTCTGDRVVLDGRDVALLRITVAGGGNVGDVNVTLRVVSGPGRVVGVGNGRASTHQRPQGDTIETNYGLARAVVMVTLDCTTPGRATSAAIDSHVGATTVLDVCPSPLPDVVVQVTAHGTAMQPARITIQTSGDPGDAPLAVAQRSEPCPFSYIDTFPY